MSEETAGRPQLREGAALQPGSAAGGEISFPFFQFSKTWNEERERNEIQEMEFLFFFWPIKGIIRGNLPDVQGLPDSLISGAAGAGGHSQFALLSFFLASLLTNQSVQCCILLIPHLLEEPLEELPNGN